eukprot:12143309-Ditylum_brightwellii.AAC.1
MEIVSWAPGDNGKMVNDVKTEHALFTNRGAAAAMNGTANSYADPPVAAAPAPVYKPAPVAAAAPAKGAVPPTPETEGPCKKELNYQCVAAAIGCC